ncbi:hypothetical protein RRF57_000167 [Xylaria bambusicola]|uniref:Uncharacterized protein n=1 Tax=Xylaria bambusicola TaxID=326684 RepID=A0AAN7UF59_9PEZI
MLTLILQHDIRAAKAEPSAPASFADDASIIVRYDDTTFEERRRAVYHEGLELTALAEYGSPATTSPEAAHSALNTPCANLASHIFPEEVLVEASTGDFDNARLETNSGHIT